MKLSSLSRNMLIACSLMVALAASAIEARRGNRGPCLPLEERVLGVEVAGVHKAYPLRSLARSVNRHGELLDSIGNRHLRIRYEATQCSAEAFDEQGRPWPATMSYWVEWVAFHPNTALWRAP